MAAPTDRVQVLKQESAAGGGTEADRDPFNAWNTIEEIEDALSATGIFIQPVGGPADEAALIWREGNDLKVKDPSNPSGANLIGGTDVGVNTDFLLENEPPEPTNDYSITRSAGVVTKEEWKRNAGATLIKSIDYTRSGGMVTEELVKVFAADGTTQLGRVKVVYARSGGQVVSATRTREL